MLNRALRDHVGMTQLEHPFGEQTCSPKGCSWLDAEWRAEAAYAPPLCRITRSESAG